MALPSSAVEGGGKGIGTPCIMRMRCQRFVLNVLIVCILEEFKVEIEEKIVSRNKITK